MAPIRNPSRNSMRRETRVEKMGNKGGGKERDEVVLPGERDRPFEAARSRR